MKNLILTLILCSSSTSAFAGEGENNQVGGGEKKEGYSTTKPLGVPVKTTVGTTKVSTRGSVTTAAVTSTVRPTATRTASVSRVNLRRPTATVTSTTPTAPVGGGQSQPPPPSNVGGQ